jgi:predicted MPP superfamily phosphohydrolase
LFGKNVTGAPSGQLCPRACLLLVMTLCSALSGQTTTPASRPPDVVYQIAFVSDPHISPDRRFSDYVANFQRVIDQVNHANVDAVLFGGDLMQSYQPASAQKFLELEKQLNAKAWFVPGNHDVGNKPVPPKAATVTDARIAQYEKAIGPAFFSAEILPGVRVIGIASSLFDTQLSKVSNMSWTNPATGSHLS